MHFLRFICFIGFGTRSDICVVILGFYIAAGTAAVGSAEVGADSGQRSSFRSGWILLVLRIVE